MTSKMETIDAVPHPWSREALFAKAQRYAEEMGSYSQDEWQFGLWSTLVLEILARAALAAKSPALLADLKDWNNVYFGLGFDPTAPKFVAKSADMKTVLSRLRDVYPNFTIELESFAALHTARRNEEVHSGGTPFDVIGASTWLPMFYEACHTLLECMGEALESLFGVDEAKVAGTLMAAAKDHAAKAIGQTISAHRTVWDGKTADDRDNLAVQAAAWAMKSDGHRAKCPACGNDGLITGAPVASAKRTLDGDTVIEKQMYLPSRFECVACGLKINGYSQLSACGLGDPFAATTEYDAAEYYGQMAQDYDSPDFNEPW
jgi:hypothetical protein